VRLLSVLLLLSLFSCAADKRPSEAPGAELLVGVADRRGQEIRVCGKYYDVGTAVVCFGDEGSYDAYSTSLRFPEETGKRKNPPQGKRYGTRRNLPPALARSVAERGWSLPSLASFVDQFVVHYDVCGSSRQCFKVLQDLRGLSVHFLLDVDGTIYQTLDLKERAWHAGVANDRSLGVEIAQIGAYPREKHRALETWYEVDAEGPRVRFPKWMKKTGIRTKDFVARPARKSKQAGFINGRQYWQYDFTNEQYEALIRLCTGLCKLFPKLLPQYPKTESGSLRLDCLSKSERLAYSGFLGHWHVKTSKQDPGPAFDWERFLGAVRTRLRPSPSRGLGLPSTWDA